MLYLKQANREDIDEEYKAVSQFSRFENGFENIFYGMSKASFASKGINTLEDLAAGKKLKSYQVPETYFFLWDDNTIVGLFKIRHYLNDALRNGAGHIGFGIIPQYRNRHYATEGLKLALEECKKLVKEDEVYMACYKWNRPSIQVQLNNGARIVKEDEGIYHTRIKIR